ncbi:hypothetical protein BRADI_2g26566v3, partial [Brachypodium distachyon]
MDLIAWNCRGIGNPRTVRDLVHLSHSNKVKFVFLCKTRQNKDKVRRIRNRLSLRDFAGSSSLGNSGGLALFWHEHVP